MLNPVIISVIGYHGGSSPDMILQRKSNDILKIGKTYWLHRSYKAKPEIIQKACTGISYCFFIAASGTSSTKPYGVSQPTRIDEVAKEWSIDKENWVPFIVEQSVVSGKVKDGMAHALVFDQLETIKEDIEVDLWDYEENLGGALRFYPNACSICCKNAIVRQVTPKSRMRKLIAIGRLCKPFSVWLR